MYALKSTMFAEGSAAEDDVDEGKSGCASYVDEDEVVVVVEEDEEEVLLELLDDEEVEEEVVVVGIEEEMIGESPG